MVFRYKYFLLIVSFFMFISGCVSSSIKYRDISEMELKQKEMINSFFGGVGYKTENPSLIAGNLNNRIVSAAWWGFSKDNSTHALQSAIKSGAKKVIVPDMGFPWIVNPIFLESNQTIIFEKGVIVLAVKGEYMDKGDKLFTAYEKENITLMGYGAEFKMYKRDYSKRPYRESQWRHTLELGGCRNINIYGLTMRESGGDGIYIGSGGKGYCENIHIKDVVLDGHYRQAISVVSVKNLLVENSYLINTRGHNPQAGIDFEPNFRSEFLVNCVIKNCLIANNSGRGVIVFAANLKSDSNPFSIRIESCTFEHHFVCVTVHMSRDNPRGNISLIRNKYSGINKLPRSENLTYNIIE